MKVISQKIKGPKHFDHNLGEYVQGKRPGLNRVQCVQVAVGSLPKGSAPAPRSSRKMKRRERKFVNAPVS